MITKKYSNQKTINNKMYKCFILHWHFAQNRFLKKLFFKLNQIKLNITIIIIFSENRKDKEQTSTATILSVFSRIAPPLKQNILVAPLPIYYEKKYCRNIIIYSSMQAISFKTIVMTHPLKFNAQNINSGW